MRDQDGFVMGLRHRRPWRPAGRVVLIEDITRSDRPRLATYRPPLPVIWTLLPVCLAWGALVIGIAVLARVL